MGTVGTEGIVGATLPRSAGHVAMVALRWWARGISGSASSEMKCDKIKSLGMTHSIRVGKGDVCVRLGEGECEKAMKRRRDEPSATTGG